jgi:hypothetical protein
MPPPDGIGQAGDWRARLLPPGLLALALAGISLLVTTHNPHRAGALGGCPVHWLTGGYCPGCGSLRAVYDLEHGRLLEAAGHNALTVFIVLPWLATWWGLTLHAALRAGRRGPELAPRAASSLQKSAWAVLAAALVFTLLRNLPGSVLAP